jgi:hypothetical protein
MPSPLIYLDSDNNVVVERVLDRNNILTDGEIIAPTAAAVNVYTDAAHSAGVSNATSLSLTLYSGVTAAPARFFATIPSNADLSRDTTYYVVAALTFTDASTSQTYKLTLELQLVGGFK